MRKRKKKALIEVVRFRTQWELHSALELASSHAYVGGTHSNNVNGYLNSKRFGSKHVETLAGRSFRAHEAFNRAFIAPTTSVRHAENKLLAACKDRCPLNSQRRSNLKNAPGWVYVLVQE